MAGEYKVAQAVLDQAIQQTEGDRSMSTDSLISALLGLLLSEQAKSRPKEDILSFVEHHLDNLGDDEHVITRGC